MEKKVYIDPDVVCPICSTMCLRNVAAPSTGQLTCSECKSLVNYQEMHGRMFISNVVIHSEQK